MPLCDSSQKQCTFFSKTAQSKVTLSFTRQPTQLYLCTVPNQDTDIQLAKLEC